MNRVTELAVARAPAGLGQFRAARIDAQNRQISYRIICACGAGSGTIISQFSEEDRFWCDPLVFECAACGRSAPFFDSRNDGYNAVLNGFSAYAARERDEPVNCAGCGSYRHELVASYRYEFEDEEVEEEWTDDEREQMPDVFSSVEFILTCSDCGSVQALGEFECA